MPPTPSRSQRTSAAEAGFTLVELVIVSALLLTVLGIAFDGLIQITKSEAFQNDRNTSLDSMRLTLNQLTKELRQATDVSDSSTAQHLEFDSFISAVATHFTYDASGTTLTRQVGSGTPRAVETDLSSTSLFTYVDAPPTLGAQWVKILLGVRPKRAPDTTLVLDSEVNLRNRIAT